MIQARVDGRSQGFAVLDDVGNEWTRQGDAFQWRPFPNRFFYSKDQNATVAPRFEVWVADGEPAAAVKSPAPPLLAEPQRIELPSIAKPLKEKTDGDKPAAESMAVGDLFGRPLPVLRAARGETVWLDLQAGAGATPELRTPDGFSGRLYSIEAHGDALVPCDAAGKPSLPDGTAHRYDHPRMRTGAIIPGHPAGHWLAEITVPKSVRAGRFTLHLAAGCAVPLEVWDFALPDRLSFVPQMNAYELPDAQEIAYYRMAHENRCCLNCLRYSWQGNVSDGCAPKTAADGTWDWTAWDRRFGPLLDGSAFADLPRGRTPVNNFYLPLNENWPMDHERAYRGGYWIENSYPASYWTEFREAARRFARHIAEKGWADTTFEFYLNGKVYYKADRSSWSKCSAPWILDEPVNTQDFWALRRFGREFLAGTASVGSVPARPGPMIADDRTCAAKNLVFRCDISRPEWQRDLLDGVCGEEVLSGALRPYCDRIMARQARYGERVFMYGSPNNIGTANVQCSAWCLDAWCLGAERRPAVEHDRHG